jgi:hypothetical protein
MPALCSRAQRLPHSSLLLSINPAPSGTTHIFFNPVQAGLSDTQAPARTSCRPNRATQRGLVSLAVAIRPNGTTRRRRSLSSLESAKGLENDAAYRFIRNKQSPAPCTLRKVRTMRDRSLCGVLTPPSSSFPPKTLIRSYSAQIQ